MHVQGYVIVRAAFPSWLDHVAGDLRQSWRSKAITATWMEKKKTRINLSAGGRFRRELTARGREVVQAVLCATAHTHGLEVAGLNFRPEGLYAIHNSWACTTPQGMHTDYSSVMVQDYVGTPRYPRSAIWAACAPFVIVSRDHGSITVPAHCVIFFMADFWHGGGCVRSELPRFHGFQLPPALPVPAAVYD